MSRSTYDDEPVALDQLEEHTLRSVSGPAAGVFLTTAATLGVGFVTSLIIARLLGPSGQGIFATLRTDAAVIGSVLGLGVPAALYYYVSKSSRDRPAMVAFALTHSSAMACLALAVAAVAGGALAADQATADDADLYVLAAVLVPAAYLEYSFIYMLRAEQRQRFANVLSLAGRFAGLAAAVVLVAVLDAGIEGAFVAIIVVSVVQIVGAAPLLMREGLRPPFPVARKTLGYALRSHVGTLFRFTALRFDVLLLSFLASPRIVGLYVVAQMVAELLLLVPQAFGWVLSPIVTRQGERELTHRIIRVNGTLTLMVAIVMALGAPSLIRFGYGSAYADAVEPFLILLPGLWLLACAELMMWVFLARGRPGLGSWLATYQAAATVALDLLLIPPFELAGAAAASAIAYGTFALLCLAVLARHDRVPMRRLLVTTPAEALRYVGTLRRLLASRRAA